MGRGEGQGAETGAGGGGVVPGWLWGSGLGLIALVTLARLAYLAWACPYTLIEDEAHYWEWSRRLELSYYSKGPGIAWVIRAATEAFGTSEWAVRLPAVVFGAFGAWCVAGLARDVCRGGGCGGTPVGLYAAAIYICMPAFWVLGVLITIDGPYVACWGAACWAGWRAMTRGSLWAWAGLGLAIGAAFAFKYTVLLLVPGLVAGWFVLRAERETGEGETGVRRGGGRAAAGVVLAAVLALVGLAPVVAWNASHDWITVRHLLDHLGVSGAEGVERPSAPWSPWWLPELLAIQVAMAGPALLLAGASLAALRRARAERPELWRGALFLAWCGAPVLIFYMCVALVAEPEGNWPIAAWVTAAPLGAVGLAHARARHRERVRAWREAGRPGVRPHTVRVMAWRWTVGVGLIVALGFARADWLARLPGVGPLVPRGRLMYADVRGADAARILAALEAETGLEPVVMAQHYGRASQMAYYVPGRPTVYCAGAYMDGPRKQYDLWSETDLANPSTHAALAGRPALLVGGRLEQWEPAFARVEEAGQLEGEHKKGRMIYLGYGYRGFPESRP